VAAASPNARCSLDSSDQSDAADDTASAPGWVLDCSDATSGYLPVGFTSEMVRGDDRLCIDTSKDGPTSGSYGYQDEMCHDADGNSSAYPILEYQDGDANDETGEAGFRAYVYESDDDGNVAGAKWEYIGLPGELGIDPGGAQPQQTGDGRGLTRRVNWRLVADERGYNVSAPSAQFLEFTFDSRNFGTDQQYYHDAELTEPGAAGNANGN
jgi:hypothetical protein